MTDPLQSAGSQQAEPSMTNDTTEIADLLAIIRGHQATIATLQAALQAGRERAVEMEGRERELRAEYESCIERDRVAGEHARMMADQHRTDLATVNAANAALRDRVAGLTNALEDLVALVRGECPSLLNEDSGGDAELALRIDAALSAPAEGIDPSQCDHAVACPKCGTRWPSDAERRAGVETIHDPQAIRAALEDTLP